MHFWYWIRSSSTLSNFNLGVILPAVIGLPLLLLGAFMHHMDAGFWAFLKWFLLCCYALRGDI